MTRCIVAYLDGLPPSLCSPALHGTQCGASVGDLRQAKVNALREPHKGVILQSRSGEELDALMASVLDRAFKGEL